MAALTISPEEEKRVKALGFLNNKGTDNFSARIITVNGKVTAAQQKVIAEAAEKFGNGTITYTTRLTVEIPGVPFDKIEEFQEFISKAGLITGGTGSVVRPVVSAISPRMPASCLICWLEPRAPESAIMKMLLYLSSPASRTSVSSLSVSFQVSTTAR